MGIGYNYNNPRQPGVADNEITFTIVYTNQQKKKKEKQPQV
jgi:hypothetical protein